MAGAVACSDPEPPPGEEPMERGFADPSSQEVESGSPQGAVVRAESGLRAQMIDADGAPVGTVLLSTDPTRESEAVQIHVSVHLPELTPGPKGFHVHEGNRCSLPDFESAGDHFDPHGSPHGAPDEPPTSRHVGDLGNVPLDEEGFVEHTLEDGVIALDGSPSGILGRVLILHDGEDDYVSQPSGEAGDPVACGVIEENR